MIMIALGLYFLDFVLAILCEQWIIQSFFIFFLCSSFLAPQKNGCSFSYCLMLTLLTMQNTLRYGNFLIALTVTASLVLAIAFLKTRFDTSKLSYAQVFLLGFYLFEFFIIKKWALSLLGGGYFTCITFLVTLVMMSLLMGMQGNRPSFFKRLQERL